MGSDYSAQRSISEVQTHQTSEGQNVILIFRPTASHIFHRLLNPYVYRYIKYLGSLDFMAQLLKSPREWEVRYMNIVRDRRILEQMDRFRALAAGTPESNIQFQLAMRVSNIAHDLGVEIETQSETQVVVGGILAHYEYDFRSNTDPFLVIDSD